MTKPPKDGKQSPHIPMRKAYEATNLNPELGLAIQMPDADHRMLPSSRGGAGARALA